MLVSTTHGLPISKLTPFDSSGYDHIIEYVADMVPKESGSHYFGTYGIGPTQTFVNDNLIYEQTSHTADPTGFIFDLQTEGTTYRLRIRTLPPPAVPVPQSKRDVIYAVIEFRNLKVGRKVEVEIYLECWSCVVLVPVRAARHLRYMWIYVELA
ncbi:Beta-glucosidase B [Penicillium hordei]|uniref:Beta-glucosidase B n=1 Tax=Penicillium hordei TaxID=40994 RepID=A0AAD6GWD1_9EURO|nr:Beta-glucosidase B [Penicillium hordei]KAJ5592292.1 Beta-glucosidase B [Penicillium hordei]